MRKLHTKEGRAAQFRTKAERDAHLSTEAKDLKAALKKKEAQAGALQTELKASASRLGAVEQAAVEGRQRLADARQEAASAREKCVEVCSRPHSTSAPARWRLPTS